MRAVLAESYERVHRSNLIGMGVLPPQYRDGESASSVGLTVRADGRDFRAVVRIDTPGEADYYPARRDHAVRPALPPVIPGLG